MERMAILTGMEPAMVWLSGLTGAERRIFVILQNRQERACLLYTSFYDEFVDRSNTSYEEFVKQMEAYLAKLETSGNNQLLDIVNQLTAFEKSSEEQFREWFDNVKNQLSEDVAGHLQLQLDNHEERIQRLEQIVESGEMETALATAGGEELATDAGEVIAAFWRYQII